MKQLHFLRIAVLALPLAFPVAAHGQDFVNGSFEKNGNLCLINASTSVFNSNVKNTHAFGSFRKPDIASSDCGFGQAKDGNWFVGLASFVQGEIRSEVITMELSAPLVKGSQYSLSFWARSREVAPNLEIGQSMADTSAGEVFYTVSAQSLGNDWTEISVRFTAANNGKFISIRATNTGQKSGVWIDAFSIHTVFVPDAVVMASKAEPTKSSVKAADKKAGAVSGVGFYPNPTEGIIKINNGDTAAFLSLTVYNMLGTQVEQHIATPDQPVPDRIDLTDQQPGMYFVEVATAGGEKLTKRIIVSR